MAHKLIRTGSSYTIPAVPYQPARPAYTTVQIYNVSPSSVGPFAGGWVFPSNTNGAQGTPELGGGNGSAPIFLPSGGGTSGAPQTYTVTTVHPATPEVAGTPVQRIDNPPLGWTAGAHSIAALRGTGNATFSVAGKVSAVAIGLSGEKVPRPGYTHIRTGLLLTDGAVRSVATGASLGTYTTADVFKLLVRATGVSITKNDAEIAAEANPYGAGEALFLSASLYGAGDFVVDPDLVEVLGGTSVAAMPALSAISAESVYASSRANFPAITASSGQASRSLAVFPAARAFSSDHRGGTSFAALPGLAVDSYGGTVVVVPLTSSYAQLPGMAATSILLVGETGTSTAMLPAIKGLSADHAGGNSTALFPAATALSYVEPPDMAYLLEVIALDFPMTASKVDEVVLRDVIVLDVQMAATPVETVRLEDAIVLGVLMSTTEIDLVSLPTVIILDIPITLPGAQLEVHAVNLDGFGSTAYTDYPFTSFARIGDRYYGAKLDGLFLLGGPNDDGAPIDANFCPGKLDFGTPLEKTIAEIYAGIASEARLLVRIATPCGTFDYQAQSSSPQLQQHRFKLGKGLKANYLTPVFYNQDGADFEVDSLEFSVADLSRKTQS